MFFIFLFFIDLLNCFSVPYSILDTSKSMHLGLKKYCSSSGIGVYQPQPVQVVTQATTFTNPTQMNSSAVGYGVPPAYTFQQIEEGLNVK